MSKSLVLGGPHGRIEISADALDGLVGGALAGVEGTQLARGRHALEIEGRDGHVAVEVAIAVDEGRVLPDVAEAVQRAVAGTVGHVTGLPVEVDVSVIAVHA